MASVTASLTIDLSDSGSFSTALTTPAPGYWLMDEGFDLQARGRSREHDAAEMSEFVIRLDNKDGRFSPKNTGSAYYPDFTSYKRMRAQLVFNAVTYTEFIGLITDIKISPDREAKLAEVTLRDYMFLLSRTDVKRPLMRDQYTGVIINRLLDDVEGADGRQKATSRELSTYAVVGSAVLTVMTGDEKILEGPDALRVVTSGANAGALWTAPTDLGGQAITAVAYVKPERDADIGANVRIELHDEVGLVAGSGNVALASRDYWTRIRVSGTYAGTSEFVKIHAPTSGTQFRIATVPHVIPAFNEFLRDDIDDGTQMLKQYSYHRGPALEAIQEVRDNELGALFYFDGSGDPHFEDKTYRWRTTRCLTSQATFEDKIIDYQESSDDRVKEVILDHPHFVDGEPGTVVWEADRVIQLPPSSTVHIDADYGGGLVRNSITPVSGTDYTASFAGDGAGPTALGNVTFAFIDFGTGSRGSFTNTSTTRIVYVRTYRVRGTPIRAASDASPATYTPSGGPALAATYTHSYQYNGTEPAISSWARYIGDRYSAQRERLGLRLVPPFPDVDNASDISDMEDILGRQVSDRVTIVNDTMDFSTKVNADYYIDRIDISCQGENLSCEWGLSPVDDTYFMAGDTLLDVLVMP